MKPFSTVLWLIQLKSIFRLYLHLDCLCNLCWRIAQWILKSVWSWCDRFFCLFWPFFLINVMEQRINTLYLAVCSIWKSIKTQPHHTVCTVFQIIYFSPFGSIQCLLSVSDLFLFTKHHLNHLLFSVISSLQHSTQKREKRKTVFVCFFTYLMFICIYIHTIQKRWLHSFHL